MYIVLFRCFVVKRLRFSKTSDSVVEIWRLGKLKRKLKNLEVCYETIWFDLICSYDKGYEMYLEVISLIYV
jgi:hypothetical protein